MHIKIKQKKVLDAWLKNGMRDMKSAILSAGYSESTARVPSVITKSETWKELMTEYFPDELLAKKHQELLNQRNVITYNEDLWDEQLGKYVSVKVSKDIGMNVTAVAKGLEMAYKMKGLYKEQRDTWRIITPIYNLIYKPEFIEATRNYDQEIMRQIQNDIARKSGREGTPLWN